VKSRKLLFSFTNHAKPIILTDVSEGKFPVKELTGLLQKKEEVFLVNTEHDCLIGRTSDISNILITEVETEQDIIQNENVEQAEKIKNKSRQEKIEKDKKEYKKKLIIKTTPTEK